jgi:hypothetical protein
MSSLCVSVSNSCNSQCNSCNSQYDAPGRMSSLCVSISNSCNSQCNSCNSQYDAPGRMSSFCVSICTFMPLYDACRASASVSVLSCLCTSFCINICSFASSCHLSRKTRSACNSCNSVLYQAYWCMRPSAASVCGLKLPVYAALSY